MNIESLNREEDLQREIAMSLTPPCRVLVKDGKVTEEGRKAGIKL
jgi:hypothetical protein